jgi:hypothetical protein
VPDGAARQAKVARGNALSTMALWATALSAVCQFIAFML